jgi:hypothetical protein
MTEEQAKQLLKSLKIIATCLMMIVAAGVGSGISILEDYFQQPKPSSTRPSTLRV